MRSAASVTLVDEIEQQLKQSLTRVQPDQEFVNHLHSRLQHPSQLSIEKRQSLGLGLLLITASLFSGIVFVFLMRLFRPASS